MPSETRTLDLHFRRTPRGDKPPPTPNLTRHRAPIYIIAIVVLSGIAVSIYQSNYPSYLFRYRLVVEVETPQGLRTGSSVMEHRGGIMSTFPNGDRSWSEVRGEAAFVDLGGGRNVIATFGFEPDCCQSGSLPEKILHAFGLPNNIKGWAAMEKFEGSAELAGGDTPVLATFHNINDVNTFQVVRPEDFGRVFGEGYGLTRVFVERTDSPVTHDLELYLPFLDQLLADAKRGGGLSGTTTDTSKPKHSLFRRGR